jgi:hypothetical protein
MNVRVRLFLFFFVIQMHVGALVLQQYNEYAGALYFGTCLIVGLTSPKWYVNILRFVAGKPKPKKETKLNKRLVKFLIKENRLYYVQIKYNVVNRKKIYSIFTSTDVHLTLHELEETSSRILISDAKSKYEDFDEAMAKARLLKYEYRKVMRVNAMKNKTGDINV